MINRLENLTKLFALLSVTASAIASAQPMILQLDLQVRNVQFAGINWVEGHGWFEDAGTRSDRLRRGFRTADYVSV